MRFVGLIVWIGFAAVAVGEPPQLRIATYNASLNRNAAGQLSNDLSTTGNAQARQVAEILQRIRADVIVINEFDYDVDGLAMRRFHDNYLAIGQNGQAALNYPHRYAAPSNTGITSGFDLDNANGYVAQPGSTNTTRDRYGNDAFGFGWFPSQYSFVVYSRFPIQTAAVRTFQMFRWKDMPGAVLPDQSGTPAIGDWYSAAELEVVRLSSKNHCDIPIEIAPGQVVHLLASHPTPPSFDGAEDRNGRRNHDEIRLWADYIGNAAYVYDDNGNRGGLRTPQRFLIAGDLNADPLDGDSFQNAIGQLLMHPAVNAGYFPSSPGGPEQARKGGANNSHRGDPAFDTADFNDFSVGNLHVDYLLPSRQGISILGGGVFWPLESDATFSLIAASDHRLVWLDLVLTPIIAEAVRELRAVRETNDIVLQWKTQSGVIYTVQTRNDLGGWNDALQMPVSIDPAAQFARAVDRDAVSGLARLYRVAAAFGESAGPPAPSRARNLVPEVRQRANQGAARPTRVRF